MKIYLALDLKGGKCVRLEQGDLSTSKVFSSDPLEQVKKFENLGFKDLHIVDLDAAANSSVNNSDIIRKIAHETSLSIQLGGGIRTMEQIDFWISNGVKRVIIGTQAVKDIKFLENACQSYPSKVSLAIDARDGIIAINAWQDLSELHVLDFVKKVENMSLYSIIYTDISKDGMLCGPNYEVLKTVTSVTRHAVIASGGVSSIKDLKKIKEINGVGGAIIGTAVYEGNIKLEELKTFIN